MSRAPPPHSPPAVAARDAHLARALPRSGSRRAAGRVSRVGVGGRARPARRQRGQRVAVQRAARVRQAGARAALARAAAGAPVSPGAPGCGRLRHVLSNTSRMQAAVPVLFLAARQGQLRSKHVGEHVMRVCRALARLLFGRQAADLCPLRAAPAAPGPRGACAARGGPESAPHGTACRTPRSATARAAPSACRAPPASTCCRTHQCSWAATLQARRPATSLSHPRLGKSSDMPVCLWPQDALVGQNILHRLHFRKQELRTNAVSLRR